MKINSISANHHTAKKQNLSFGNRYSCLSDIVMQNPEETGKKANKIVNCLNDGFLSLADYYVKRTQRTNPAFAEKFFDEAEASAELIKKMKNAKKEAKKLGVSATFPYDEEMARIIIDELEQLKKAGYPLPSKLTCYTKAVSGMMRESHKTSGFYLPETTNKKIGLLPDYNAITGYKLRHTLDHEEGHRLHQANDPELFDYLRTTKFTPEFERLIQEEIGEYEASKPPEFIAGAFDKKVNGKTLSSQLQSLYDELKGPKTDTTLSPQRFLEDFERKFNR